MIVAGDIGGTKTHLALFDWKKNRVDPVRLESFHSADYTSLEDMLTEFLVPPKSPTPIDEFATEKSAAAKPEPEHPAETPPKIDAACFGIAGPVIQNRCHTTNLPWVVDGATLAKQFDIPRVKLLNDLEAMAHGILLLRPDEVEILNAESTTAQPARPLRAREPDWANPSSSGTARAINLCRRKGVMRTSHRTMTTKLNCCAICAVTTCT